MRTKSTNSRLTSINQHIVDNVEQKMIRYSLLIVITSIFGSGCEAQQAPISLAPDEQAVLREGCLLIKSAPRQAKCNASVDRLSLVVGSRAKSTPSTVKDDVSLRSIQFDSGDVREALRKICIEPRGPYKGDELEKSTIWCNFDKNGRLSIPSFAYGNLDSSLANITVDEAGAMQRFEASASKGEMVALAVLLQEKYGPPKVETNEVENKVGAKFTQQVSRWIDKRGTVITVYSIYDKIDAGRVTIESASLVRTIEAVQKIKKEIDKGKL